MTTLSLSAIKDQLKDKNGFIDTSLIRKYIFEKFSDTVYFPYFYSSVIILIIF